MRKTIYLSLAALGVASMATAAVMSTDAPERRTERTAQVANADRSQETRATPAASENATEKKECRKRCWFFD